MKILITGGAGFIGSNVANAYLEDGHEVVVLDNLSRVGVIKNIKWLRRHKNFTFKRGDVRHSWRVVDAMRGVDVVFHYAAQVGVATSIEDPRNDLDINILGTFNVLEAAKRHKKKPYIIFASTNKVYGEIDVDKPVSEKQPLSFCTPYGCSKGAAEQYVLDYSRVYGVPSIVLRMSCIYGNRQFGTEDQGWLAHFMISHFNKKGVTIYGDGNQVRDALYIDDYVALMKRLVELRLQGAYNVGGGEENVISVNECLQKIGNADIVYSSWRPSDQRYYVSDISKIKRETGWNPAINTTEGLRRLREWITSPEFQ